MSTKGQLTVVINDLKDAFSNYGQKKEIKKLDILLANSNKFNFDNLIEAVNNIGYDSNLSTVERLSVAYEIVDSKLPLIIDIIDKSYFELKQNTKIKFDLSVIFSKFEEILLIGFVFLMIIMIWSTVNFQNSLNSNGEVITSNSNPEADVDTTSKGTLSLKSERAAFLGTDYKSIKLYIITDTASKGKLKIFFDGSSLKPFDIVNFETKAQSGSYSVELDLPLNTDKVKWIE